VETYSPNFADWDNDLSDARGGDAEPFQRNWQHGLSGYQARCRCEVCVAAKREYNREWMRRWRARQREEVAAGV
jgi:hypothetical protein